MLVGLGFDVGICMCLGVQLLIEVAKKCDKEKLPKKTPQLQYSKELIMVCGGVDGFKLCRQPINLQ